MFYETLVIGLLAAVLFTELTDIYPGGIIVPAYCALYIDQPLRILVTVGVALLSLVCYKVMARYFLLFGKRRFVMLVLWGGFWTQMWFVLQPQMFPDALGLQAIGWIIPGLLANNLERQKFIPTLASLFTVAVVTYFLVRIWAALGV